MSLAGIARKGVATAAKITKSFQPTISVQSWTGQDGAGNDSFAAPHTYAVGTGVLVDRTLKQVPTLGGRVMVIQATIYFLIAPVTPIDPRDIIKLSDGFTAPVLEAGGFEDAGTGKPFVTTVRLGSLR